MNESYSTKRYRFTNKERDDETGLYYFGVRYYAAWLGRWTSADPGDFVDGLNLYVYVRNNPVGFIDEEGCFSTGIIPQYNESELDDSTENQSVIIYLTGFGPSGSGSSGSGSSEGSRSSNSDSGYSGSSGYISGFETNLRRELNSDDNVVIRSYRSDFFDEANKSAIKDFVKENLGENGQLIIVGYSWGGDTALELAEEYEEAYLSDGYEVIDLLITIDPADGPSVFSNESNTEVARVVINATNYYQLDIEARSESEGRRLTAKNTDITNLNNVIVTSDDNNGDPVNHQNVDDIVQSRVINDIIEKLRE